MLLINLAGLTLIGAIVWWFWLYRPRTTAAAAETRILITVADGVYQPAHISLPAGRPVDLHFLRKDPSPCAATVIFPELELSRELPMEREIRVQLPALKPGQYHFSCQMQMYRGLLEVEANGA